MRQVTSPGPQRRRERRSTTTRERPRRFARDALILLGSGEMVLGRAGAEETLADAVEAARALDDGWAMTHSRARRGTATPDPGRVRRRHRDAGRGGAAGPGARQPVHAGDRRQRAGHPGAAHRRRRRRAPPVPGGHPAVRRGRDHLDVGVRPARVGHRGGPSWTASRGGRAVRRRGDDQRRVVTGRRLPARPGLRAGGGHHACAPSSGRRRSEAAWERGRELRTEDLPDWADRIRPLREPR